MNKKREIIIIIIVFIVATILAFPKYLGDLKIYKKEKSDLANSDVEFVIDTPASVGLFKNVLDRSELLFKDTNISSFIVMKDNRLVYEKYYNDFTKDTFSNVFSITKSIISAFIGISIDKGFIKNVDTEISSFFPKQYENMTIEHLLTMMPDFSAEDTEFIYTNSASHLLSIILSESAEQNAEDFGNKYLFNKIGILNYKWLQDGQGNNIGSSELFLRSRDMLKFGLLYLNNGTWDGEQLIKKDWINISTSKKIDTSEESIGTNNIGYGYNWWLDTIDGYDFYTAFGYGGQYICIISDLNMVIVLTSKPKDLLINSEQPEIKKVLKDIIIPALK